MRAMVMLLLGCCLSVNAQQWQQLADFPGTARDDAAAFSIGSNIYFGTGYMSGWVLATDWYSYDISNVWGGTWQAAAPLPATPRQYCTGIDGGYLFGGTDANGPLNELWNYNEVMDTWTQLASLPAPGRYASSAFTSNGRIFIANGMLANGIPTNEFWEYVATTDSWVQLADVPGPARHRACSFNEHISVQQYGYVAGGADDSFNALNDVWQYEPLVDNWTTVDSMPEARYGAKAAWVSSSGPTLIGGASNDSTFHSNGYSYDYLNDLWANLGQLIPTPIRGGAMAYGFGSSGNYYTLYGTGLDSSLTRRNEVYIEGFSFSIGERDPFSFTLSPNPGTTHFNINTQATYENSEMLITDALGRTVFREEMLGGSHRVETAPWPPGLYYITLRSATFSSTAKWIKLSNSN